MSVGKKSSWEYLDGELCFNLWAETGSLGKVRRRLIDMGIVNEQRGGNPPTEAGIRMAARRWMARNPEEARSRLREIEYPNTWMDDDSEWWKWMVFQAKDALGSDEFDSFIVKNGLAEYRDMAVNA